MKVAIKETMCFAKSEKSEDYFTLKEGSVHLCRQVEDDPEDDKNVILTLAGFKKRFRCPARSITLLIGKSQPDFRVDMWFDRIGYQAEYYLDGRIAGIECRDFGGSPKAKSLVQWMIRNFDALLGKLRKEH